MGEIFSFMLPPFVATMLVVAIHVYLGLHVIEREIIFVDLALAQIAAFGTTVAFILGVQPEGSLGYLFSLGFVVVGAGLFSITRVQEQRVPQEAVIGITYAVATSATVLVADRAPGGAEHIKEILTGSILWVHWPMIIRIAILYLLVGAFYLIFHRRFATLTEKYRTGELSPEDRFWDFVFYLTFGVVIVMSVRVAGVLLVFSFLVVPTSIALLVTDTWAKRLWLGWALGLVVTAAGLYLSYVLDVPTGPAIVVLLGLSLAAFATARAVRKAN